MKSLALVSGAAALQAQDSSVSTVINLLEELKGKVAADLQTEGAMMEEYSTWCGEQDTTTSYAIKDDQRIIGELEAAIEGAQGSLEAAGAAIDSLGPEIAQKKSESGEAEKVRADEHSAFSAKEKELTEAHDMLRRAHSVLSQSLTNNFSLMQSGKSGIRDVISALGAIVNASWLNPAHAEKLREAMVQVGDELTLTQPQASSYSYEAKSGGILKTIEEMSDDVETSLREATTAETKARHSFEMLTQSLANEMESLSKQLAAAQQQKGSAGEKLGAAQGDLAKTQESLAADQEYLKTVTHDCQGKSADWAERQAAAAGETEALEKAKDILSKGVTVLAQTSVSVRRVKAGDFDKREHVSLLLRRLGHKFNSFGLLQAAASASADPFSKVTGLLRDMLAKLEQQAGEEADHHEMCVTELEKNNAKKAKKQSQMDKHSTRMDKSTAQMATLKDEISTLEQEVKDLAKAVTEATKMRNDEKAENEQVTADNKQSAAAVADAIKVLREYYSEPAGAAFVQQPTVTFSANKSGATGSIIAILETCETDFTKVFTETEAQEEEAGAAYAKFMQEAEVTKAKKEATIGGKKSQVETLGVSKNQISEDLANTSAELDAVQKTLDTLEKECENKAMSYEERKARREQEMEGLQQALEILSPGEGEGSAFVQKRAFLARA